MTAFLAQDRAMCMNAGSSGLRTGQLYYVAACRMSPSGNQSISVLGFPGEWFISTRFVRVADPTPRRWPQSK